jgi:hypothetical protein
MTTKHFVDPLSTHVYSIDIDNSNNNAFHAAALKSGWQEVLSPTPVDGTAESRYQARNAVQAVLDFGAQKWGYNSIVEAITFINSSVPNLVADATVLNQWRDDCWSWANPLIATIESGANIVAFIDSMPSQPTRP